jgi:ribokinase
MIVTTNHFPNPGETVIGKNFLMTQGGKGANQAVAASRMNAMVTFITRLGKDVFGKESLKNLKNENIDISKIQIDPTEHSGIALITVDKNAENNIVVSPGANSKLFFSSEELREIITANSIVLIQLEIPLETVKQISKLTKENGAFLVLNPAPILTLDPEILVNIDLITPNEKEASVLSGIEVNDEKSASEAAKIIHTLGPKIVIITLGSKGAYLSTEDECLIIPSYPVIAVDTTAAGDVFNGALVAAIAQGENIKNSVKQGCKASAISVTKRGAQISIPTFKELENYYKQI